VATFSSRVAADRGSGCARLRSGSARSRDVRRPGFGRYRVGCARLLRAAWEEDDLDTSIGRLEARGGRGTQVTITGDGHPLRLDPT